MSNKYKFIISYYVVVSTVYANYFYFGVEMMDKVHGVDLSTLSEEERKAVLEILQEVSQGKDSKKYNELISADYAEIPVDIETFLKDRRYMGNSWHLPDGTFKLYPFWLNKLKELFPNNIDTAVNNFIESGARGLGKSDIAVAIGQYLMHRVMCLKNPLAYFGLRPSEKICFAFMNITEYLARDIGISKFQTSIQMSPWFMERGTLSGTKQVVWNPPSYIDIIIGSQPRHVIGQPIFYCLDGDTVILTDKGDRKLSELVDKEIKVLSVDDEYNTVWSESCSVKPTAKDTIEYAVELEDGTEIHCTKNHKFMLKDGSYKEAQYLSVEDELFDIHPYGYIYKTTNTKNGKIYIGQHHAKEFDPSYLGSGYLLMKSISKYSRDVFKVELIEWCISKKDLNEREIYYIDKYNSQNLSVGYNIACGGQGGNLGPEVIKRISESLKGVPCSEEKRKKISRSLIGRKNPEAGKKISEKLKGKKRTEEQRQRYREVAMKRDYTNYTSAIKGKVAITDGHITKFVVPELPLPIGFKYGSSGAGIKHNMSNYYLDSEARFRNSESKSGRNNSMFNHGERVSEGRNGKATIRYFYEDQVFECRKDLMSFLGSIGQDISVNIIRDYVNGNCSGKHKLKYWSILQKLSWRNKNEDKVNSQDYSL